MESFNSNTICSLIGEEVLNPGSKKNYVRENIVGEGLQKNSKGSPYENWKYFTFLIGELQVDEVIEAYQRFEGAFHRLEEKQEDFTSLLSDDEFEEEQVMVESQQQFLEVLMIARDFINSKSYSKDENDIGVADDDDFRRQSNRHKVSGEDELGRRGR